MQIRNNIYTLQELTRSIQNTLKEKYVSAYWVKAEMNKLNFYSHSGHCFPELLERQSGKVVAQMRATLWREDHSRINRLFIETMGQPLKDGIKILFLARVAFDPVYGLTLRIMDIDPTYTLGDIEREKQETIQRLKEEGVFHKNRSLPIPLLPQRLAIISVETSKGLADFYEVIRKNPWGYCFFTMLFPSLLQGDKAVETIIRQLQHIGKAKRHFDAVAIIRGGGDEAGLSCYNNYRLAKAIATYPLPVLSGIGHSTNETVTEMISCYNAITPTKLAEHLIQLFHEVAFPLKEAEDVLRSLPNQIIAQEKEQLSTSSTIISKAVFSKFSLLRQQLQSTGFRLKREVFHTIGQSSHIIDQQSKYLSSRSMGILSKGHQQWQYSLKSLMLNTGKHLQLMHENLSTQEKHVKNLDPINVLKRGYSITTLDGRAMRSHKEASTGQVLHTRLYDGSIASIVTNTDSTDSHKNHGKQT